MDTERRPQLPSLSFFDAEKSKVKDELYFPRHASTASSLSLSNTSPTSHYPPGPPPPYSQPHSTSATQYSTASWQNGQPDVRTSPTSRRPSDETKEEAKISARQSLPSISDVLAHDPPRSYPSSQPPVPAIRPTTSSQLNSSPSPESARAYEIDTRHLPSKSLPGGYAPSESVKPAHAPVQEPHHLHHQSAAKLSHTPAYPRSQEPSSSTAEHQYGPPTTAVAPSGFGPGHVPYSPQYGNKLPPPPPGVSSGPIYQPSTVYGPPSATMGWKGEGAPRVDERLPGPAYHGESVKRHLENFDLETALNDITHSSGSLTDFTRRYSDQMHRYQRAGPPLSSLPSIVEVDDMMMKTRLQYDALAKIRDVVQREQAAFEQQAADQRQQQKLYGDPTPPQSDHHQPQQTQQQRAGDDGKGLTFPGADTKKRRGRAAPPGRCHSCNRAETPEWRRGPDGARTLCNACGLHYAKLTRKSNHAKQGSALTSSNLRPKENGT